MADEQDEDPLRPIRHKQKPWLKDKAPMEGAFWVGRSSKTRQRQLESGKMYPYNPEAFLDAEELYEGCCEYFEWVMTNPLYESRPFSYEGNITMAEVPKQRMMTVGGLCLYLGISTQTWNNYGKNEKFQEVHQWAGTVIRTQKLEGAAAGLLNAGIVQRILGLADRHELSGRDGSPITSINSEMDPKEAAQIYRDFLRSGSDEES